VELRRLRSSAGTPNLTPPPELDLEVSRLALEAQRALLARLTSDGDHGRRRYGGPVHNLMVADGIGPTRPFDLALIDGRRRWT
jgi:hypothetical protein